jgi:hypothetical protein
LAVDVVETKAYIMIIDVVPSIGPLDDIVIVFGASKLYSWWNVIIVVFVVVVCARDS